MMAETKRGGSMISTSSLSPLAVPFKFNSNCSSHFFSVEFENLDDYDVGHESHPDLLTSKKVSLPMYTQGFENLGIVACFGNDLLYGKKEGMMVDATGSSFGKESYAGATISSDNLLKGLHIENVSGSRECFDSGDHVAGGLNPCQISDCIPRDSTAILWEGDAQMSPDQVQKEPVSMPSVTPGFQGDFAKFLTPSDDSCAGKFKAIPETHLSYPPCGVSGRKFDMKVTPEDGPLLQADSYKGNYGFCPSEKPSAFVIGIEKSSSISDHDDSDLDSPCWKGKYTKTSESLIQSFEPPQSQQTKREKAVSLNPGASEFLPCCVEGKENSSNAIVQDGLLQADFYKCNQPCWKGKGFDTSVSLFQSFEYGQSQQNKKEKVVSLNPLAAEFLPRGVEGKEKSGNDIVQDGLLQADSYKCNQFFSPQEKLSLSVVEKSSRTLDHNENDLDSPCWKGKGIEISRSLFQSFELGQSQQNMNEKAVCLNPLAPEFVPRRVEGEKNSVNDIVQDGFSSFQDSRPYHTKFSLGECEPLKAADVEHCPFDLKRIKDVVKKNGEGASKCVSKEKSTSNNALTRFSATPMIVGDSDSGSLNFHRHETAASPSPSDVSWHGHWELLKNEKLNRLNPMASEFVPAAAGENSYLYNEHPEDGFSTFQITSTPSPMNISCEEHGLSKSITKTNSYGSNIIRIECSRDNHDRGIKEDHGSTFQGGSCPRKVIICVHI